MEEILKFNKAHNIVGRHTKEEIYSQDILDCQMALKHIQPEKEILDIGSGAGLPGLLIAILQPLSNITMSEKNQKKAYFIKKTIQTLGLSNAKIKNKAISPNTKTKKPFDIITARAFAQTRRIINLTKNNIHKRSKYLLLKGKYKKIQEELQSLDIKKFRYEITKLDHQTKERNLIMIKT